MSREPIQLLVLAVVQEQDQDTAMHALEKLNIPAVYLASSGGYLGRRNATTGAALAKESVLTRCKRFAASVSST
jgi:uncharacterized protein YaaQ